MKILLTTALFSFCLIRAEAELGLEANEVGSGFAITQHWGDGYGGFDRDYRTGKHIRVIVRDMSRKGGVVDVNVYFVGRRLPNIQRFIYAHQHQMVKLGGALEINGDFVAPELKGNEVNLPLINERWGSGATLEGWVVIGSSGGKTFGVRASSHGLLNMAEESGPNSGGLLFSDLLAEYAKRSGKPAVIVTPHEEPPAIPAGSNEVAEKNQPAVGRIVAPQFLTLTKPVVVKLQYGSATLPVGMKLAVLDQRPDVVKVRYANSEQLIPIGSTDLK